MFIEKQEYERIVTLVPRVCVDILVENPEGRVLLLKRTNEPAVGQWWFPGGRVHIGETRDQAALRKLNEECALKPDASHLNEVGSFDLLFDVDGRTWHDVTILFHLRLTAETAIKTDLQSSAAGWFDQEQCQSLNLHPYLKENILVHLETRSHPLKAKAASL